MKKTVIKTLAAVACGTIIMASCQSNDGWTIKGTVEGADGTTLYIEKPSGASWVVLDSVVTDKNGTFEYVAAVPATAQDIYRLRLGDRHIFFPVEGTDIVTLNTTSAAFDNGHNLAGTLAAEQFCMVDSLVNAAIARTGVGAAAGDSLLIHQLGDVILADTTNVVTYYTVTRYIGQQPIFDFTTKPKVGLIGAAANKYAQNRPDDPRAAELKAMLDAGKARYRKPGRANTMEARLSGRIPVDLVRKDVNGKEHDFNAMADRGGVTILNLTRFDLASQPANTVALNEVYEKYKNAGLDIYQVSFDTNEATWREAAAKMPWTSVYNRPSDPIDVLVKYNANPTDGSISFVIDRNGEVVARVTDPSKLSAEVAKQF